MIWQTHEWKKIKLMYCTVSLRARSLAVFFFLLFNTRPQWLKGLVNLTCVNQRMMTTMIKRNLIFRPEPTCLLLVSAEPPRSLGNVRGGQGEGGGCCLLSRGWITDRLKTPSGAVSDAEPTRGSLGRMDEGTELSLTIAHIVRRLRGSHLHSQIERQAKVSPFRPGLLACG